MFMPVIMAGGSGTRLWPLSRGNYPKQFLALTGAHSMLQQTLLRLKGIAHSAPLLICNEDHRFIAAEQLRQLHINDAAILLEPVGRNTAPAIALAALKAVQQGDDPLLLVLAADHVINDTAAFQSAVLQAENFANSGKLVTFGIVPTHAMAIFAVVAAPLMLIMCSRLWKNPMQQRPNNICKPVNITGTAACLCLKLRLIYSSCRHFGRIFIRPVSRR
jgi:mannose-1-phosphate guanylyltransferase/mannose-6-phosphate isomerase